MGIALFRGALLVLLAAVALTTGCALSKPKVDTDGIADALRNRRMDFCHCYQNEIKRGVKNLEGKVVVVFTINDQGKTTKSAVKNSTLQNTAVESCVLRTVDSIQYPTLDKGSVAEITYPFRFKLKTDATENAVSC